LALRKTSRWTIPGVSTAAPSTNLGR
jgi:hypothetical protein